MARSAEIPDTVAVRRLGTGSLPADWRRYPAPETLADIGTEWARQADTVALAVPSVIIPTEWNYLLNPTHRDFRRVELGRPQAFGLDPRLFARARARRP